MKLRNKAQGAWVDEVTYWVLNCFKPDAPFQVDPDVGKVYLGEDLVLDVDRDDEGEWFARLDSHCGNCNKDWQAGEIWDLASLWDAICEGKGPCWDWKCRIAIPDDMQFLVETGLPKPLPKIAFADEKPEEKP